MYHDIMWFRVTSDPGPPTEQNDPSGSRGWLVAGVWNTGGPGVGPVEHIIFKRRLTNKELMQDRLFPYIYVNGAKTDVKIDCLSYTPNPYSPANGTEWQQLGTVDFDLFHNFYLNNIPLGKVTPYINPERFLVDVEMQLTIHKDILNYLGFSYWANRAGFTGYTFFGGKVGESEYLGTQGQFAWASAEDSLIALSDNFIVLSDTLQLNSFDASRVIYSTEANNVGVELELAGGEKRGRRKNILMTIPVNDNTNGIVQYEAATPIFIDMNNTERLNIRNLNFRVLQKNFKSIQTLQKTAVMTVLIQNGNK